VIDNGVMIGVAIEDLKIYIAVRRQKDVSVFKGSFFFWFISFAKSVVGFYSL